MKSLFDQSRYQFLKHIFYPEMNNQMGGILKRWKLSAQVKMAESELRNRLLYPRFFFDEFSNQELEKWLLTAKKELAAQNAYLKRSEVEVRRSIPSIKIHLPNEEHVRYSFMSSINVPQDHLNQAVANTVSAVTLGSRFSWLSPMRLPIRNHPLNLSIFTQIAQGMPIETFLDKDDRIHPEDDVRHERVDNRILENLMLFLSYGTWRPNRVKFRDNRVVKDSSVQTVNR